MSTATPLAGFGITRGYAPATLKLIERLKAGRIGDVLTDAELTAVAGRATAPGGAGYANLHTAIGVVMREHGLLWERELRAGAIRCLDDAGKVGSAAKDRKLIQRRAKRAMTKLRIVTVANLGEDERTKALAMSAQMGTLSLFAGADTTRKLEARHASSPVPIAKLMEMFE